MDLLSEQNASRIDGHLRLPAGFLSTRWRDVAIKAMFNEDEEMAAFTAVKWHSNELCYRVIFV